MSRLLAILIFIPSISLAQTWKNYNQKSLSLYESMDFKKAIVYADSAMAVLDEKCSNAFIASLSNKANAQLALDRMSEALTNFNLVYQLSKKLYESPHISHLEALHDIAKTYIELSKYDSAEYYLNEASEVRHKMAESPPANRHTTFLPLQRITIHLKNLSAILYHRKGQYNKAVKVLLDQKSLIEKVYPDNYMYLDDYRTTINNLAAYYNENEQFEEALDYAKIYYFSIDKNEVRDHFQALESLGSTFLNLGFYDSSFYYFNQALQLAENSPLKRSYSHAIALNNLADLFAETEQYKQAIQLLEKSMNIQKEMAVLHPFLYSTSLFNLAEAYHWNGNYPKADSLYHLVIDDLLQKTRTNFPSMSDEEKISFYNVQQDIIHSYRSFALEISGLLPLQDKANPYIDSKLSAKLYNLQLATKAIILNSSRRMKRNILSSNDTLLISTYNTWLEKKKSLAKLLLKENVVSAQITDLEQAIETDEKWLITHSNYFKKGYVPEVSTWKDVQQALKPGEAAVEMIRLVDGLLYAALIITPSVKKPVFALLLSRRSRLLEQHYYKNYINSILLQMDDTISYQAFLKPVMDTIQHYMPGKKLPERIYVSNEGIFNKINLNTLWDPGRKQYISELTNIVLTSNTRELIDRNTQVNPGSASLFGRPDYSGIQLYGETPVDLPETESEVKNIDEILNKNKIRTSVFMGEEASESILSHTNNPSVLHIATHGFFINAAIDDWSLTDNMIRSGILLASDSLNDGIVTALDLSTLSLDSTALTVLSACETAKTDYQTNEGIYGIQRALHIAGSGNLVMSLWKVDDKATSILMTAFYKEWMKTGNLEKSFFSAQKNTRAIYPHPYYWGAFVLSVN